MMLLGKYSPCKWRLPIRKDDPLAAILVDLSEEGKAIYIVLQTTLKPMVSGFAR
jgi:hypothetical protein